MSGEDATPSRRVQPDIATAALQAARSGSRRRRRVAGRSAGGAKPGGYSGSGPDPRDPQALGSLITGLLADRGWERTAAESGVLARWQQLVGPQIAGHAAPQSLRGGELVLVAESSAWATQLRLLAPRILLRIASEVGPDIVTRVRVHGPTAPSWRKGPRRVAGRGPRDTYG